MRCRRRRQALRMVDDRDDIDLTWHHQVDDSVRMLQDLRESTRRHIRGLPPRTVGIGEGLIYRPTYLRSAVDCP